MKQLFYKIIYQAQINFILRNINKLLAPVLPKKIRLSPSGKITLKLDSGKKLFISTNESNFITHLLFWEGYKNFEYTDIFLRLIKKVDCFYDVGSNIGYYSLLAAAENPQCQVVAFEPAEGPSHYLNKNVSFNQLDNITVEEIALSEKSGEITFYENKNRKYTYLKYNLGGTGNAGYHNNKSKFNSKTVPTQTFDEYFNASNHEKIGLVKMDTEGTEHLILEHAEIILRDIKPIFICETLFQNIEDKLEDLFSKYGYEFYNHTEKGLEKVQSIKRETDNGVRNCFFVHPSAFHKIAEFVI